MIIEIPLIGGANSVTDIEDVGTGFVQFVNWSDPQSFKGRGKLTQWQGFGDETTVTNVGGQSRCIFWILPESGIVRFFVYDADDKTVRMLSSVFTIYSTSSSTVLTNDVTAGTGDTSGKIFTNANATDIRIYNNGQFLRFANGLADKPTLLYDIPATRDFFWSDKNAVDGLIVDYSYPRRIIDALITTDTYNSGWFTASGLGYQVSTHDLSSKSYYYKCSYVYDGIQESPLDTFIGDTTSVSLTECVPNLTLELEIGGSLSTFNKRITAINIYRATSFDGAYYKVGSVNTLNPDPNTISVSDASNRRGVYLSGTAIGSNYLNAGILVANMFDTFSGLGTGQDPNAQREYTFASSSGNIGTLTTSVNDLDDTVWEISGANETYTTTNGTDPGQTTPHAYVRWNATALAYEPATASTDAFNSGGGSTWTLSDCSGAHSGSYGIEESSSGTAKLTTTGTGSGSSSPYAEQTLTLTTNTDYVLQAYIPYLDSGSEVKIGIGTTSGASLAFDVAELVNMAGLDDSTPHGLALQGKRYFQITFNSGSVTTCYLQIRVAKASSGHANLYLDKLRVYKLKLDTTGNTFYGGKNVVTSSSLALGDKDSHKGHIYHMSASAIGTTSCERGWIRASTGKAILTYHGGSFPQNETSQGLDKHLIINDNYMWREQSTKQILNFYDKALADGTSHPYGDTINVVNYKYATISGGRQFVANVKLDPDGASETHKDWIVFSELNQYDVLPITNFIQLNDMQGGEITGIEKVLGDIVVFMERGVYRLSVPSYNPTEWSLAETYENIGCEAPDTIVPWNGGVFFMSKDNYYYLDSNFNLSAVGDPIRDEIASFTTSAHAIVDDVHNRLILNPKSTSHTYDGHWTYDLKENHWRQELFGNAVDGVNVDATGYFKDEDGEIRLWDNNGSGDVKIRKVYTAGGDLDMNASTQSSILKTGLIRIADSGNTKNIRRVNFRGGQASNNVIFTLYNEGGTSIWTKTAEIPSSGNLSMRVSARAELVQLKVEVTSADDYSIERLAIEVD